MDICHYCGEPIEFRWVGGSVVPIHVNGGWCTGRSGGGRDPSSPWRPFDTAASYTDPNARCPVCGASVFFYQSPHGGRVFFDDLGWPWPKHPCTDKGQARYSQVTRPATSHYRIGFKSKDGEPLAVYKRVVEKADGEWVVLSLKNDEKPIPKRGRRIIVGIRSTELAAQQATLDDLNAAPGFVLLRDEQAAEEIDISFICARLQSVVALKAIVVPPR